MTLICAVYIITLHHSIEYRLLSVRHCNPLLCNASVSKTSRLHPVYADTCIYPQQRPLWQPAGPGAELQLMTLGAFLLHQGFTYHQLKCVLSPSPYLHKWISLNESSENNRLDRSLYLLGAYHWYKNRIRHFEKLSVFQRLYFGHVFFISYELGNWSMRGTFSSAFIITQL